MISFEAEASNFYRLFAHDSSLTASDKNIDDRSSGTNSELLTIYYDWLCSKSFKNNKISYLSTSSESKL